jgi:hypothetical protein
MHINGDGSLKSNPWSRVFLEQLTVAHLLKKSPPLAATFRSALSCPQQPATVIRAHNLKLDFNITLLYVLLGTLLKAFVDIISSGSLTSEISQ